MNIPHRFSHTLHEAAAKRTSRRRLLILFISLASLLLIGFVFWYLPHRPVSVLERAIAKTLAQQSVSFTIVDGESLASALNGRIDAQGDSSLELRKDGQHITIISADGTAFINGGDGRWLEAPSEIAQGMLGQSAGLQPTSLEPIDRKRIERLYDQHSFIKVSKVFNEEPVAGQLSYHYQVKADKKRLRAFLGAVQREIPELKIQATQITTILDASLLNRSLDVWISKKDGLIRQVAYAEAGGNTIQIRLDKYGEDFDITKPQSAVPLLEALRR